MKITKQFFIFRQIYEDGMVTEDLISQDDVVFELLSSTSKEIHIVGKVEKEFTDDVDQTELEDLRSRLDNIYDKIDNIISNLDDARYEADDILDEANY